MFRVSKTEKHSHTAVTIDGQFSADYIDLVELCCQQAIAAGKPVRLFLRDVSAIDDTARSLLRRLAQKGVHLRATGLYTSYLIRTL